MKYLPNDTNAYYEGKSSEVVFLSIFRSETDWRQVICDAYNLSHLEDSNFQERTKELVTDEDYDFLPSDESLEILANGDVLVEYTIDFVDALQNEDFDDNETTVDRFIEYMVNNSEYTRAFKNDLYWNYMEYLYKELYSIEMRLRETLSYIYVIEFYPNLDEFHKNLNKQPLIPRTSERKDIVGETSKLGENIFFRFSFSDYRNILESKEVKVQQLIAIMKESQDFDSVRDGLLGRNISNEKSIDFIESINQELESIEKVRNAIMHFRRPSKNEMQNFIASKGRLEEKIDYFYYNINGFNISLLNLRHGELYTYIGTDNDEFIKGKKYELVRIIYGDGIFLTEKGEHSFPFFDKEIDLYRKE